MALEKVKEVEGTVKARFVLSLFAVSYIDVKNPA